MKKIFVVFCFLFFCFSQWWGLFNAPIDSFMGDVQRLMYVHVPAAWNSFIAFFAVFVSSIVYLFRKNLFWDHLAGSAAEVGVVLTGLTLALGSIWGRPTWGVWWTWDARLTTTAILFFLYVGYLAFRGFIDDRSRRAALSAPLGVIIFLNVPIVYMSVQWWRTLHQPLSSPKTVDAGMVLPLRLNAFAFLFILTCFVYFRFRLSREKERLENARLEGGT